MKKRFSCFLCVFLILLLASCDLLGGSLSDYITEYTENANLEVFVIPDVYPRDASQTACVTNPATPIILYLRNPMKYEIVFEYTFHIASIQLLYSVQYQQTDPIQFIPVSDDYSTYSMIFPSAFLDQIDRNAFIDSELSSKDISGTLKAYDKETHREFGSLELTLSANTPPDPVATYMMQLDQDPAGEKADSARYILCFEIPRSDRNGDFDTIKINNSTWKIDYNFGSQDGLKLTPYGGNTGKLLVNPAPTDELPYGIDFYPLEEGSVDKFEPMGLTANPPFDTFYYITGDTRSDTEMLYTLTITDKAGLKSESTVSNKADKLNPATITIPSSPVFDNFYIAGLDNSLTINIKAATATTEGKPVADASYEYIVQEVDEEGNLLSPDNIPEWKEDTSGTIQLPPNAENNTYYTITVRSKRTGCLTSDETSTKDIFKVIRSNHFFVAHSSDGTDDDNDGTLLYPYYSFKKCMEEIDKYQSNLKETFDRTLPDGFYIDVLEDYNVTGSDDVFSSSYLINNKIDSSTSFSGKLTIQGVDESGSPLSGTSRRTIDAGSSGGLLSWSAVANNTATLSLKNLTFTNGYSKESGKYAGLYFQTISVPGNPDNNNEKLHVTITNCDITHMTGSYGYGIYFYGGNSSLSDTSTSTVTITDCTISDNEKTGINHSYAAQGSSYEKLILAGNTKIQNNSDGGVNESLGLIIQSKNVIISNNKGYGVSVGAWAKIEIAGATITNNTDASNNPKNLYLVESTNNSGVVTRANITVTGDLSGSSIGVTTANQPAVGELIPFVDGWQASYGSPASVFTSDAGCGIKTDDSGTPVLAVNSGTGGYHFTEDVTISVSSDNYIPGVEKQITVSASLDGAEPVDITNDVTSWHLELTENGETIPTSWYSVSSNTLTLKQALPRNTYTLYIDIVYNGRHYSDSIAITPPPSVASLTAAPTGGTVTAASQSDLAQLATWVNGGSSLENVTILLDSDVTITGTYRAIGSSTKFQGTFDGQGHTVNINSQTTDATYYGLFGDVYGGTIKNVTVTGSITTSGDRKYIGGIVGHLSSGTIENCINNVTISGATYAGGIVGFPVSCTIKNCINNASLSGTQYAGGIGGSKNASSTENTVSIINCVNNGDVTVSTDNGTSGGLMGYVDSISNYKLNFNNAANIGTITNFNGPSSEIYGSDIRRINTLKNVIYLQNSGSGTFSNNNDNETLYLASSYAAEIHAETTLSDIVSRLNSWITSQPADERGTYKKWKVSADGTKIVFEDEE
ncbi:MAG: hypothetical protein KBT02_04955 [Treponema sp.]|nr:hypothetical protein [Candidatus Treponema caballi]